MTGFAMYKLLHLLGVFMVFASLGGRTIHAVNGGDKSSDRSRALVSATHGLGMLLSLGGGLAMLHAGGMGMPGWVHVKLTIWLILGVAIAIPNRMPQLGKPLWVLLPLLGAVAAWLAAAKPF